MGEVLTFAPRPKVAEATPDEPRPMTAAEIRERLGAVLDNALDTAERLIAVLDRMDGDPDLEDGADAEPSLAAPEHHDGSQVGWCRGNDRDREAETPEIVLPEVSSEQREADILVWPLPWSGSSNVIAAAGVMLLEMVAGR